MSGLPALPMGTHTDNGTSKKNSESPKRKRPEGEERDERRQPLPPAPSPPDNPVSPVN